MHNLEAIATRLRQELEARTAARDKALALTRQLTRSCALAIRAVHRQDREQAQQLLQEAQQLVLTLHELLRPYPELFYAGYTQDALKEFVEANITLALTENGTLPSPEALGVEPAVYLGGLAEAVGELRRRCLDLLRHGYSAEIERLLGYMEDIYTVLVTMDYPDAVTGGLRRLTDIARSLLERTRGEVTLALRQDLLTREMQRLEAWLEQRREEE